MSYPTLTKGGVTTVTFSRGNTFPADTTYHPRQSIGIAEAGQVRVSTLSDPEIFMPVQFEALPEADINALLAFLQDPLVNWAAFSVTYTDTDGDAWTVRIVDTTFTRSQVASGLYNVKLLFRRELA